MIAIGLTQADPNTRSGYFPGWSTPSTLGIGYHGDNGGIYHHSSRSVEKAEPFTAGDVVGCFMYRVHCKDEDIILVQFTKNGEKILFPRILKKAEWYPTIGMASPRSSVETNFGDDPFIWNPNGI